MLSTKKKQGGASALALRVLQGIVTPVPYDMDAGEIIYTFPEMGGIQINTDEMYNQLDRAKKIGKIAYMSVDRVDGDVHINLILDTDEAPIKKEDDLFARGGYVLAYVWNVSVPYFSEAGDIIVERRTNGNIYRVG